MSTESNPAQGRSGLALVTLRAALDGEFRSRLLENPHRAILETFGVELSPGLRLKFIEKGSNVDLLVVLPDLVKDAGLLPPEDLDTVLGGAAGGRRSVRAAHPAPVGAG